MQSVVDPWLFEKLAEHTRTLTDELGTRYVWLEGAFGGATVLVWTTPKAFVRVLKTVSRLPFKGRMVLAVSEGGEAELARALYWSEPRRVLFIEHPHQALEGIPTLALGLVGLGDKLKAALRSWTLLED